MSDKYVVEYYAIWDMLIKLLKSGIADRKILEKMNTKCAERLNCREVILDRRECDYGKYG